MTVTHILANKGDRVITVHPSITVAEAVNVLRTQGIGAVVASDGGDQVSGILSERDVIRLLADEGPAALDKPVREAMTSPVSTCVPTDSVDDVMRRMTAGRFRHMPVVTEGIMVGMVSIGDVVKRRIREVETEAEDLRSFISGTP